MLKFKTLEKSVKELQDKALQISNTPACEKTPESGKNMCN